MITVAMLNIFVVFFAFLESRKLYRHGLKISFLLIFLFLALRYNYGNDYPGYLDFFIGINQYASIDYFDKSQHFELGWIFLCRLFEPLGFFAMMAVLALFNCFVYYRFIKKYVPVQYYWFAVFLYVFNPGFMLVHSTAMRQSVAIALFILSLDYLYRKDAIRYFLCIGIAYLFHASAIILVPVFLLGLFNWKINKFSGLALFLVFLSLFLFGKSLLPDINKFTSAYFRQYESYQVAGEKGKGTGLKILFLSALFVLTLYYERFQNKETALLFKIAIISFMLIPMVMLIMMLGRMDMYFQIATIAVFPIIILNVKEWFIRKFIAVLIIFITLYGFYQFFESEIWRKAFGTYQTIFSAPEFY